MVDNYTQKENEGRKKLVESYMDLIVNGNIQIRFSQNKYERYDYKLTAYTADEPDTYIVGEIKNVDREYGKYNRNGIDYGFQIDLSKLEEVIEEADIDNRNARLIVFFSDMTVIWDLRQIPFRDRAKVVKCTSTTATNYSNGAKPKMETYLYLNEAMYYKNNKTTNYEN